MKKAIKSIGKSLYIEGVYLKSDLRSNETLVQSVLEEFIEIFKRTENCENIFLFKKKRVLDSVKNNKVLLHFNEDAMIREVFYNELTDPKKVDFEIEYETIQEDNSTEVKNDDKTVVGKILRTETSIKYSAIQRIVKKVSQLIPIISIDSFEDTELRIMDEVILGYGRTRRITIVFNNEGFEFAWDGEYLGKAEV